MKKLFKNDEDFAFSIYSSIANSTFDATTLNTYEKSLNQLFNCSDEL